MAKILVVEDDTNIAKTLLVNLRARKFTAFHVSNGYEALERAVEIYPDVMLLDLGLPDLDGLSVIKGIRKWSELPIIVVSARHESQSKVEALDQGADDYVTKPFAMDELLARLRAALRRSKLGELEKDTVSSADGHLVIDLAHQKVLCEGKVIKLTPIEWRILSLFAKNPDRLISQKEMLHSVWGPSYDRESNYLRVYMSQLRHKLEKDSAKPKYFHTELGMGYRFTM